MRIAGIDVSSFAVDIVTVPDVGEPGDPEWHCFRLEAEGDAFDRTRKVAVAVPGPSQEFWDDIVGVGIEEPAGRNVGFSFRVQGAVLTRIPQNRLVEKFMPSQWRKAVGLPGNCAKEQVFEWVTVQLGGRPASQDAADAYCLALAMRRRMEEQDGERAA